MSMQRLIVIPLLLFAGTVFAQDSCFFQQERAMRYELAYVEQCAKDKVVFQNLLAYFYSTGHKVEKDYKQALRWYQRAADGRYPAAMYNLGNLYYDGHGTKQDYKQAFFWYEKAAKAGDIQGQHNLGYMYGKGLGVKKDPVLAYSWFYVGMKQGHKASFINANNLLESLGKKGFEEGVRYGNELYSLYAKKPLNNPL